MAVLNELRPGLDEKLYENALVIELRARGYAIEQQRQFPVHYRSELIGTLIPDLIVQRKVIVDPKVVTAFSETHIAQMLGYPEYQRAGGRVAVELQGIETRLEACD